MKANRRSNDTTHSYIYFHCEFKCIATLRSGFSVLSIQSISLVSDLKSVWFSSYGSMILFSIFILLCYFLHALVHPLNRFLCVYFTWYLLVCNLFERFFLHFISLHNCLILQSSNVCLLEFIVGNIYILKCRSIPTLCLNLRLSI